MPDLTLLPGENAFALAGADGQTLRIHPLWLRERCTDAASMDSTTGQRLQNPADLAAHPVIESVRQSADGAYHIRFTDGAHGRFTTASLLAELPHPTDPTQPGPHPLERRNPAAAPLPLARSCG
jgi:gamma-butyrobetaine dioxygenase